MDERTSLTFTLRGLDERDTKLFRSFVRLVDHRTQHRWEWTEFSADLVILHESIHEQPSSGVTLRVGRQPQSTRPTGNYLGLPLRADAMEVCLNAMGMRALAARQTASGQRLVAAPHPAAAADMLVLLLRWPPQRLLTSAHHMRLATLLTGQPTTLQALCRRSGLAPEICAAFLNRLDAIGLLRWTATAPRSSAAPGPARGILDRIRQRLAQLTRASVHE